MERGTFVRGLSLDRRLRKDSRTHDDVRFQIEILLRENNISFQPLEINS